jgi:hypothetical protein
MADPPIKGEDLEGEAAASGSGDVIQVQGNIINSTIIIKSVVKDDQVLDLEKLPPEPGEPPYQGLQYFDERDANRFFGREQLTVRVIGRLQRARFLAVIGASGSGKSSLVRAGVIPALKSGGRLSDGSLPPSDSPHWAYRTFTPGGHPLDTLAAALSEPGALPTQLDNLRQELARNPQSLVLAIHSLLAREGSSHLLIFVDQLEELFTQTRSLEERQAFIQALSAISAEEDPQPVSLVVCLRADFYAQVAQHDALRELISQHQEFIGAMSRNELVDAVVGPLNQGGWKIQEGLVKVILRDVGYEPGALPLLSHALLETWKRRRGRTLTLSGYTESGGVDGAIRETAEAVFNGLTEQQRPIARLIFLHLTELTEDAQDTRRRAPFSELITRSTDEATIQAVINILAQARLVTTGTIEPGETRVVEVAHESLIREWPTLRKWLTEDRQGLLLHRQLTEATEDWEKSGRDDGLLYRSRRLEAVEAWAAKPDNANSLSLQEIAFLEATRKNAREEWEKEQRLLRLRRTQRIFAGVIASLVLVVALMAYLNLRPRPSRMDGLYNIAIAEFAELGADGQIHPIPDGSGLKTSQNIASALQASLEQNPGLLIWNDGPALKKQGVQIGIVDGAQLASSTARRLNVAQSASSTAGRLNADMIIYGIVDSRHQPPELKMGMYLAPHLSDVLDEVNGTFDLSRPIAVDGGLGSAPVQAVISQQADLLATLALGQSESQLGHTLEALEIYQKAAQLAPNSSLVQFFIGREYLFSLEREPVLQVASDAFEQQASIALEKAIQLDSQNARAQIGLGSLYIKQAKRLLGQAADSEYTDQAFQQMMDLLDKADRAYAAALQAKTTTAQYGVPVGDLANLGLGDARLTRAIAQLGYGQPDEAGKAFADSVQMLSATLPAFQGPGLERYLAQNYQFLGSAYQNTGYLAFLTGDPAGALENYQKAVEQFDACIQLGSTSNDRVIRVDIAEANCTPQRQATERLIQEIGGP